MMETVIGLFWDEENVQSAIQRMKEVGFAEKEISVLARQDEVRRLLNGDQGHIVGKYAFWGALLGIATVGPLGLGASLCECTLLRFNPGFGMGVLVAFIAIGTAFGAFLGCFFGVDESERCYHLYCRGVCLGAKVVAVQASDELVAKATRTLRNVKGVGVKSI